LSLLGGVIGIALSFPAASGFFSLTRDLFLVFEITQTTLVLQLLACVVIGFFAAIAPMLNSRRIRIVDGLRAVT
jgi:putative ABC transport system permease protein